MDDSVNMICTIPASSALSINGFIFEDHSTIDNAMDTVTTVSAKCYGLPLSLVGDGRDVGTGFIPGAAVPRSLPMELWPNELLNECPGLASRAMTESVTAATGHDHYELSRSEAQRVIRAREALDLPRQGIGDRSQGRLHRVPVQDRVRDGDDLPALVSSSTTCDCGGGYHRRGDRVQDRDDLPALVSSSATCDCGGGYHRTGDRRLLRGGAGGERRPWQVARVAEIDTTRIFNGVANAIAVAGDAGLDFRYKDLDFAAWAQDVTEDLAARGSRTRMRSELDALLAKFDTSLFRREPVWTQPRVVGAYVDDIYIANGDTITVLDTRSVFSSLPAPFTSVFRREPVWTQPRVGGACVNGEVQGMLGRDVRDGRLAGGARSAG